MNRVTVLFLICAIQLSVATEAFTAPPPVRLKNGLEVFYSYEAITAIDGSDAELKELFKLNQDRLPRNGLAQELSSPVILSLTELAGGFCKKSVTKEKTLSIGERQLFSDIDFDRGAVQFSSYLAEKIADDFALMFWGREIQKSEKDLVTQLIASVGKDDSASPASTERVLLFLCTYYGSSLAFLVK